MSEDEPGDSHLLERCYNLRNHLGLDLAELENAFMATPGILQQAGELVAEADEVVNTCRHELDIAKAEAAERYRDSGVTVEARISSMIPLDSTVRLCNRRLINARFEMEVCDSLYKALEVQSRLLSRAADMIVSGYISPTVINERRRAEIRRAREEEKSDSVYRNRVGRPTARRQQQSEE
ncbi:MAG: hypothetical protein J2P48_06875 [Alphaproteobacteria bacterium]|nr:hypothetical protein [Alphaproteobacteria bacterium]